MKSSKKALLAMFLLAFNWGCLATPTATPPSHDIDLFFNNPCSAPCWQGLVIGESTEDQVLEVLASLEFIFHKNLRIIPESVRDLNSENLVDGKLIVVTCAYHPE